MRTPPATTFHVDLATAQGVFDDIAVSSAKGGPIKERVFDLLALLGRRSREESAYYFYITDDEPGASRLLARTLALALHEPGDMLDDDVPIILSSLLSHKRWKHCLRDHDALFHLVGAFVFVTERMEPTNVASANLYRALLYTMAQDEWPFPEHRTIDSTSLADGGRPVLQELCDAAFGPAWWQVVVPAPEISCVFDVLIDSHPPLLHFASRIDALDLPALPENVCVA